MNSIGPIIAKYRKEKHLTQPELSDLLLKEGIEVTDKALSSWESGRTEPGINQLFSLCKILGIKDIYEDVFGNNPYNPLNRLNDLGKDRAYEYIDMLASNEKFSKQVDSKSRRIIKLYTLGVSAGTGNFLDDENFEEFETDEFIPAGTDFAVHITGDSMMPMFKDKQIIFIHSQDTLEDGEIGIFFLDGNAYCKKLMRNKKGTSLISLNKKYDPIPITEDSALAVFGRVLI
jgi:phage repressor protein C with HTH and peptisase S24 domain